MYRVLYGSQLRRTVRNKIHLNKIVVRKTSTFMKRTPIIKMPSTTSATSAGTSAILK